jgi:hypothetical protein
MIEIIVFSTVIFAILLFYYNTYKRAMSITKEKRAKIKVKKVTLLLCSLLFALCSLFVYTAFMEAKKSYGWLKAILIGVAAAVANNVIILPSVKFISGLYLDTIFTAAAAFAGGLVSGIISAVLTTVLYGLANTITTGMPYFGAYYLYMLCSIAIVLLVRLFARFFPEECDSVRVIGGQTQPYNGKIRQGSLFIMLATLSLVMCLVVSVMGGLISAGITAITGVVDKSGPPETYFRLGFIKQGFNLTASEILARIPVNIADKPIAVFGGYGIAFLVKKIVKFRGGGGGEKDPLAVL